MDSCRAEAYNAVRPMTLVAELCVPVKPHALPKLRRATFSISAPGGSPGRESHARTRCVQLADTYLATHVPSGRVRLLATEAVPLTDIGFRLGRLRTSVTRPRERTGSAQQGRERLLSGPGFERSLVGTVWFEPSVRSRSLKSGLVVCFWSKLGPAWKRLCVGTNIVDIGALSAVW